MGKHCLSLAACAALVLVLPAPSSAQSVPHPQWVGTWAAAPLLVERGFNLRPLSGVTLREIVHVSVGGPQLRVRFTNAYGADPLTIADAHVALSAGNGAIQPGIDHAVTFGGATSVNIPPGAELFSDPVALAVPPLSDLAVSFYLPPQVMRAETFHDFADQDNFLADGDVSTAQDLPGATKFSSWYFLDGIDVSAVAGSRAIVALGDSITDGSLSTPNANRRWPDVLAARLHEDPNLKNVAVLNEGIGGNRVLNEDYGPSALARLDRDVLAQSGVRYVIVLESINDIGSLERPRAPYDEIDAQQLEMALKQIADAAHEHGIKAIGATLTPYGGAFYYSGKGEQIREAVNDWIRNSGTFDGVADFDKATRDPQDPNRFNPAYDSGDHLHPKDAGYKAMGEAIDLTLFAQQTTR
ncbi:MAG: SGNH/GDSL hydrolase family protein [Terracidiphilus sp.]|jgi:lysophospholipase L1-like esterase